jgi:hypothetical protein
VTAFLAQRIYELNAKLIASEAETRAFAQSLNEARTKLHNIIEIYAGMEGVTPTLSEEKYLMHIIKQMVKEAT